jgi:hypothetical protein
MNLAAFKLRFPDGEVFVDAEHGPMYRRRYDFCLWTEPFSPENNNEKIDALDVTLFTP